jgi:hypothetical protein
MSTTVMLSVEAMDMRTCASASGGRASCHEWQGADQGFCCREWCHDRLVGRVFADPRFAKIARSVGGGRHMSLTCTDARPLMAGVGRCWVSWLYQWLYGAGRSRKSRDPGRLQFRYVATKCTIILTCLADPAWRPARGWDRCATHPKVLWGAGVKVVPCTLRVAHRGLPLTLVGQPAACEPFQPPDAFMPPSPRPFPRNRADG